MGSVAVVTETSQLTHQQVRLPFPEELLGAASPANVEYCLTLLQSFLESGYVTLDMWPQNGLLRLSRANVASLLSHGAGLRVGIQRGGLSVLEDKVCLHALHICCPWESEMHFY